MDKPDIKLIKNQDIDNQVNQPQQVEMPFAIVDGESITELPSDLYIPPVALKVFLDTFEGPLDLLLYLIINQLCFQNQELARLQYFQKIGF